MTIEHERSSQATRKETSTDGPPVNNQVLYEVSNNLSNEKIKPIPRLTIVVVNFNTQDLLVNCLDSILRHPSKLSFRLSVVDNGSQDNSAAIVKEKFPEVELIASADNLGFSKANNLVLKGVNTEYVLLLNSDTLVSPRAFDSMVNFMDSNPDIGILGPKLVRPDGSFDPGSKMGFATVENLVARKIGLARLFPKSRLFGGYHLRNIDENETSDVNAVAGACMLIRKDALEKVGLFDEEFFLGCEDLDYCYRTTKVDSPYGKPYRVVYYPEVTITHFGRQTRQKFPMISILEFHKSSWRLYQKYQAEDHSPLYNYLIKEAICLTAYIRVGVTLTKLLFQKRKP